MESGLEGRNNPDLVRIPEPEDTVSMESGLEGRNNDGRTSNDTRSYR